MLVKLFAYVTRITTNGKTAIHCDIGRYFLEFLCSCIFNGCPSAIAEKTSKEGKILIWFCIL